MDEDDEKMVAEVAERIRWHRALTGLTQQEYADAIGMKRSQLNNWENGRQRISIGGALALEAAYGLSLDFIYLGRDYSLPIALLTAWRARDRQT